MAKKRRDRIKDLLADKPHEGILVQGWVRTRRDSKGGFSFIEINDGSCLKNIQIIADHKLDSFKDWNHPLTTGSAVTLALTAAIIFEPGIGASPVAMVEKEIAAATPFTQVLVEQGLVITNA